MPDLPADPGALTASAASGAPGAALALRVTLATAVLVLGASSLIQAATRVPVLYPFTGYATYVVLVAVTVALQRTQPRFLRLLLQALHLGALALGLGFGVAGWLAPGRVPLPTHFDVTLMVDDLATAGIIALSSLGPGRKGGAWRRAFVLGPLLLLGGKGQAQPGVGARHGAMLGLGAAFFVYLSVVSVVWADGGMAATDLANFNHILWSDPHFASWMVVLSTLALAVIASLDAEGRFPSVWVQLLTYLAATLIGCASVALMVAVLLLARDATARPAAG